MSYTWGTTDLNKWPAIKATFYANTSVYGDNIVVDELGGIEMNQPIQFTGSNIANIKTDNTYYVSEINPTFKVANVGTLRTIKIRSSYYGDSTSIITPGENGNMTVALMPLSAYSGDNSYDTYVVFDQENILK
jgi:hypothetical protein